MIGGLDNPAIVDRRICRDRAERWLQAAWREREREGRLMIMLARRSAATSAAAFAYERALYWARRARRPA